MLAPEIFTYKTSLYSQIYPKEAIADSPIFQWFFHSGDGAGSWVWRGDNLWHDRWMETLDVNPDFVEYTISP